MIRAALTMRVVEVGPHREPRDSISHDWLRRLRDWGVTPVPLPNLADEASELLDEARADVLVLTGGEDFGETPVRDRAERALLAHALSRGLPVFGVCRGLQLLAIEFGGALVPVEGHVACRHEVTVEGAFADLYGGRATMNSYHRFGVAADGLRDGLAAFTRDDAGHVEGLAHRDRPVAGVMWHPERDPSTRGDRGLLLRLAEEGAFWA